MFQFELIQAILISFPQLIEQWNMVGCTISYLNSTHLESSNFAITKHIVLKF
jgi:hypothetical protein